MDIVPVVLDASDAYPFHITANRYSRSNGFSDDDGITLVLTHATGMHKECWQPILAILFANPALNIRDAWSIDAPNHGHAAVLNQAALQTTWTETFPWDEYGRAVGHFLSASPDRGAHVDFTKRALYALGHSSGAVGMAWLHDDPTQFPDIRFRQLILVEPMLSPPGGNITSETAYFYPATYQRRDVWPSRAAALDEFTKSKGYKRWDPAIVRLFVEHALRPHPASQFSTGIYNGVVLACSRMHEAACYRGGYPIAANIVPVLGDISRSNVPVHVIWGQLQDSLSPATKETLVDESKSGIAFNSVTWIPDAGHLVIQHAPSQVAHAIMQILDTSMRSKL